MGLLDYDLAASSTAALDGPAKPGVSDLCGAAVPRHTDLTHILPSPCPLLRFGRRVLPLRDLGLRLQFSSTFFVFVGATESLLNTYHPILLFAATF